MRTANEPADHTPTVAGGLRRNPDFPNFLLGNKVELFKNKKVPTNAEPVALQRVQVELFKKQKVPEDCNFLQ